MTAYRDDARALAQRITAFELEARRLEALVTPAFWRCVARSGRPLQDLRDASADGSEPAARHAALEGYVTLFSELLAGLGELEAEWTQPAKSLVVPGHYELVTSEDAFLADLGLELKRALKACASEVSIAYRYTERNKGLWDCAVDAEIFVGGAPIVVRLLCLDEADLRPRVTAIEAYTAVAPGVAELVARPETWAESLFHSLRVSRTDVGDDGRFESFFRVEAAPNAARGLLVAEVRRALLVIARVDVPTLTIRPPLATLRWSYLPDAGVLPAAVACLVALRSAVAAPLLAAK